MVKRRGTSPPIGTIAVGVAVSALLALPLGISGAQAITPAKKSECGRILVPAASWLGGAGVPVRKNVRGSSGVCHGTSFTHPEIQNGNGWDCYELAARLFAVKKWGRVGTTGGADYIPEGSPWLDFHPNGSGFLPVPGDLIIERYATHGHVTVVDRVTASQIYAVEQNATDTGRKTYPLVGSAIGGAYNNGYVRGFMHAPRNTDHGRLRPAGTVSTSRLPGFVASVDSAARRLTVSWGEVNSEVGVRTVLVQRKTYRPARNTWTRWRTGAIRYGGAADSVTLSTKPGTPYLLRARVTTEVGPGAWSNARAIG